MQKISAEEFAAYAKLVRDLTGISLDGSKSYLIETRLAPLLAEYGLGGFSELYYRLKTDPSGALARKVIDRITTQETSFFRDVAPFEMLKYKIIPELVDARKRQFPSIARPPIRIWSAACSTGQEIYSIAVSLAEVLGDFSRYNIRILATDISDQALARASRGVYSTAELERGLPETIRAKYFLPVEGGFRIKDELRALASFRRLNLLEDFSSLGRFDIVFCRNVAIYFDPEDKKRLFERIDRLLEPDGALIVGSTESLLSSSPQFEAQRYLRSVYYRRKAPKSAA